MDYILAATVLLSFISIALLYSPKVQDALDTPIFHEGQGGLHFGTKKNCRKCLKGNK